MARKYIKEIKIKYFELYHVDKYTKIDYGSTREIYISVTNLKNSIFKMEYNPANPLHNMEEYRIYKNNYKNFNFLARVKGISKDFRVLEMEKLNTKSIEDICNSSRYPIDTIFDLIKVQPNIKSKIDFDWGEVNVFIKKNKLDPEEIFYYKNWGLDKNGNLRLMDYSR